MQGQAWQHPVRVEEESMFCLQEPLLRLVSIKLKYGPWRRKLEQVYQEEIRQAQWRARRTNRHHRAKFVLHLLQRTAREMHGQVHAPWALNVGSNIGFCSGPVPYLTSLGVMASAKHGAKHALVFGKHGKRKRVCDGAIEVARPLQKLVKLATVADELSRLPAPRTCKDWIGLFFKVVSINKVGKLGSQVVRLSEN